MGGIINKNYIIHENTYDASYMKFYEYDSDYDIQKKISDFFGIEKLDDIDFTNETDINSDIVFLKLKSEGYLFKFTCKPKNNRYHIKIKQK